MKFNPSFTWIRDRLLLSLCVAIMAVGVAWAADGGSLAVLENVRGTVLVKSSDSALWEIAKNGTKLEPGDSVSSREGSSSIIRFSSGDYIKLMALSACVLDEIVDENGARSNVVSLKNGKAWTQAASEDDNPDRMILEAGGAVLDVTAAAMFVETVNSGSSACVDVFNGVANLRGIETPEVISVLQPNSRALVQNGATPDHPDGFSSSFNMENAQYSCFAEVAPETGVVKTINETGDIIITAKENVTFGDPDVVIVNYLKEDNIVKTIESDDVLIQVTMLVTFTDEVEPAVATTQEVTKEISSSSGDIVITSSTQVIFDEQEKEKEQQVATPDISGAEFSETKDLSTGPGSGVEGTEIEFIITDEETVIFIYPDDVPPEPVQKCVSPPVVSNVTAGSGSIQNGDAASVKGDSCQKEKDITISWSVISFCGDTVTNAMSIGDDQSSFSTVENGKESFFSKNISLSIDQGPVQGVIAVVDSNGNAETFSFTLQLEAHESFREPPVITSISYGGSAISAGETADAVINTCGEGTFTISGTAESKCWEVASVVMTQDGSPLDVSGAAEWSAEHGVAAADGKSAFSVKAIDSDGNEGTPVTFNISYSLDDALLAAPVIEDVSFGDDAVAAGDKILVPFEDCEPKSVAISGSVTTPCPGQAVTMVFKKNNVAKTVSGSSEWTAQDEINITDKEAQYTIVAKNSAGAESEAFEFTAEPEINVAAPESAHETVGMTNVDDLYSPMTIYRDSLEGGKLELKGSAADESGCEISYVEVSLDDGAQWSRADGTTGWTYSFQPSDGTYYVTTRAVNDAGVVSAQTDSLELIYSNTTDEDNLRAVFDSLIEAYRNKLTSNFTDLTSDEFSTNYEGIEDYSQLGNSLDNKFKANSTIYLKVSVGSVSVLEDSGSVSFSWTTNSGSAGYDYNAVFEFVKNDEQLWRFSSVQDDDTFLRYTSVASTVTLTARDATLTVDGLESTELTAEVRDSAGNLVQDGTDVIFTSNLGAVSSPEQTSDGLAVATFDSNSEVGTAIITAGSGGATSNSVSITLLPGPVAEINISIDDNPLIVDVVESTTVTAEVLDSAGNNVANGTVVTFSGSLGTITASAQTFNGIAEATFDSNTVVGTANLTASSGGITSSVLSVALLPGAPADILLSSLDMDLVANDIDSTTLIAEVSDSAGNPVADGTEVEFTSTLGEVAAIATTFNGEAEVEFLAGVDIGSATILATSGSVTSNPVSIELHPESGPLPPGMRR